ncbi:MAG: SGNH/GDSL hydrolase family protein [Chitinophagaceae bacterium]|nr:SGNH/GDSL hydrolase family protein [Chitinophagaceae bacterium]
MQKSRSGKIIKAGILLIVIFLFVEGFLGIFIYQKTGTERFASIELLKSIRKKLLPAQLTLDITSHTLTRPDSTETVNRTIAEETVKSNQFVYESWVEFRNIDFDGKYLHMSGQVRKSSPAAYFSPASDDTLDIYFLGGSTTFGFNVTDEETIPSQFVQLYKEKFPRGKSIRVYNYAVPTYYSYQELMLLSDLIYKNHTPDIVVFLDGINDFWFVKSSYYGQSYFSFIFRQLFDRGVSAKGDFRFVDTADVMWKDPVGVAPAVYYNSVIGNYINNMKNSRMMADIIGAQTYFFCQPAPFYNYPNQQKDPICFKDTNTRFDYIYATLEKKADSLPNFTFLGNMLQNETGYPFIDGLHYSPGFTRKIAEQILFRMEKEF